MKKYEFTLSIDGAVVLNRNGNRLKSVEKRYYKAIRKMEKDLAELTKGREVVITFRNDKEIHESKYKLGEVL